MTRMLAAVSVLILFGTAVADDGPYTIKLYQEKEGDLLRKTIAFTLDIKLTTTIGGETAVNTVQEGLHLIETVEVLEYPADAQRPTKLKRTFDKADRTTGGKTAPNALAGKTVVTTYTDGKATHTVDDKPATPELAALLNGDYARDMRNPTAYSPSGLPAKPLKVGDTWDVDVKKLQEEFGAKETVIDVKKSSITGKLVKAAKKDGALWGTLEFDLKFVTPPVAAADKNAPAIGEMETTVKYVIHTCLDGTQPGETIEITMGMKNTSKLPTGGTVVWNNTATGTTTTEPVTKQ